MLGAVVVRIYFMLAISIAYAIWSGIGILIMNIFGANESAEKEE